MGTSGQMSTTNQYIKYTISIDQNWQDIGGNYSNVTVSVRFFRTNTGYESYGTGTVWCKIDGNVYSASVSPSQRITNAGIVLFSQNMNIGHNADGSKYLDTSAWINISGVVSSSEQGYGQWLSTIPRTSSVSGGTGNIGSTSTINISRASSGFTHILYYSFGSISWRHIASNVGTSYTWTLPSDLYGQIPTANAGLGTIICETYSGSTYIGVSYVNFTAYVVNSEPTFTSSQISYQDTNSTVVGIMGNNQHIVRNQSNLQYSFTAATAKNSATISKYQVTFNGVTTERTSAGTINYGLINSGSNLTLTITAVDSRGNSTSASKAITVFDWLVPTAIITANRKNNYEDESYLKIDASISSVNSKNDLQLIKYRYKKTTDTSYSSYITIQNSTQYTININKIYAWDFEVVVIDKFSSTTYNFVIAKGTPIIFFDTQKISLGVNKFPVNAGSLDVEILNGKVALDYDVMGMWDDPATYTIDFNDSYYFTHSSGVFTSNNKGVNSSNAYTRLKIDATNRVNNISAKVDYTISSESGYDFGYVTANNTAAFVAYDVTVGRFIYVSGATTSSSATYTLAKGQIWYLHLGYRKDGSTHSNNDNFIINKITLS